MSTSRRYRYSHRQIADRKPKKGLFSFKKGSRKARRVRSDSDGAASWYMPNMRSKRVFANVWLPSKRTIVLSFLGLICTAWAVLMLRLPYFTIADVKFTGLKDIQDTEIRPLVTEYLAESRFSLLRNNNYFSFSSATLKEKIKNQFYLDDLSITKIFPSAILINVAERPSSIIYDNGMSYALLDGDGTLVKMLGECTSECINATTTFTTSLLITVETATTTTSTASEIAWTLPPHVPNYNAFIIQYLNVPVVYDTNHKSITVGESNILRKETVIAIENLASYVRKNEKRFNIMYFVIGDPAAGIMAKTDKNYLVYFNANSSAETQFKNIDVVLKGNTPTSYIDVRYDNRVFWK